MLVSACTVQREGMKPYCCADGSCFLSMRVCWLRWDFIWEQELLALQCGIPDAALSQHRASAQTYTYTQAAAAFLVEAEKFAIADFYAV